MPTIARVRIGGLLQWDALLVVVLTVVSLVAVERRARVLVAHRRVGLVLRRRWGPVLVRSLRRSVLILAGLGADVTHPAGAVHGGDAALPPAPSVDAPEQQEDADDDHDDDTREHPAAPKVPRRVRVAVATAVVVA